MGSRAEFPGPAAIFGNNSKNDANKVRLADTGISLANSVMEIPATECKIVIATSLYRTSRHFSSKK